MPVKDPMMAKFRTYGVIIPLVMYIVAAGACFAFYHFTYKAYDYNLTMQILAAVIVFSGFFVMAVNYFAAIKPRVEKHTHSSDPNAYLYLKSILKKNISALIGTLVFQGALLCLSGIAFDRNNDLQYYFRPEKKWIILVIIIVLVDAAQWVISRLLTKIKFGIR